MKSVPPSPLPARIFSRPGVGFLTLLLAVWIFSSGVGEARTLVRFSTNLGNFTVELFDEVMPATVANFLGYVRAGSYAGSFLHRSTTYNPASIQIVQGGGFFLSGKTVEPLSTNPPIPLEPGPANLRGTIAMARTTDPNSATSQWFFNVADNPGLDFNYAVFGRVAGAEGLAVLDAIASVPAYDASPALGPVFAELPLLQTSLQPSSLVMVESVREIQLEISSAGLTAEGFRVDWRTNPVGLPVRVLRRLALDAGADWEEVSVDNATGTFTDTNRPGNKAFYRLAYP